MSRFISALIPIAATFAFVAFAPAVAASEAATDTGLVGIVQGGIPMNQVVVVALGAGLVIAVLAVGLMLVTEMLALVRNPIVRSGRRPVRRVDSR